LGEGGALPIALSALSQHSAQPLVTLSPLSNQEYGKYVKLLWKNLIFFMKII
jgi:hypothetical protein